MKIIHLILLVSFIVSCRQNNGPCEYSISEVQAKVIAIEPYNTPGDTTQRYRVMLRFNESNLAKENQLLEDVLPRLKEKITAEFMARNHIKTGNIYPGTVSEIKSGTCTPVFVSLNYHFKTE